LPIVNNVNPGIDFLSNLQVKLLSRQCHGLFLYIDFKPSYKQWRIHRAWRAITQTALFWGQYIFEEAFFFENRFTMI